MADPLAVRGVVLLGLGAILAGLRPVDVGWSDRVVRVDGVWTEVRGGDAGVRDGDDAVVFAGWVIPVRVLSVETRVERLVGLNTATLTELETLPRVGPVLAARIVEGRPYRHVDDLDRVKGVGPATLAKLRPLVRVGASP